MSTDQTEQALPLLRGDGFWEERMKTIQAECGAPDTPEVWHALWRVRDELERWAIRYARETQRAALTHRQQCVVGQAERALSDLLKAHAMHASCQAGLLDRCLCVRCASERARAALTAAPPAQPQGEPATRDDGMPASKTERELRRLLCAVYAGASAYMDDGEASDCRAQPAIDFMRMEPAAIREAMYQRGLAQLAASPPRAVEPLTDEHAWISVDDKLPETPDDGSDVPVYVWDGELVSEDDYAEQWEQPAGPMVGGWIQTGWDFMSNSRLGKPQVTHWCHRRAPKPPQD